MSTQGRERTPRVAIIGAGMSGIGMAAHAAVDSAHGQLPLQPPR